MRHFSFARPSTANEVSLEVSMAAVSWDQLSAWQWHMEAGCQWHSSVGHYPFYPELKVANFALLLSVRQTENRIND